MQTLYLREQGCKDPW